MFGPPDPELKAAEETVDKRLAVINERLVPLLDSTAEDLENASDKTSTLCAALATVMAKVFVTKCPKALAIIDKIPTFVSKEKMENYTSLTYLSFCCPHLTGDSYTSLSSVSFVPFWAGSL